MLARHPIKCETVCHDKAATRNVKTVIYLLIGIEKSSVSGLMSWCEQLDSQQETKGCFDLHSLFHVIFD